MSATRREFITVLTASTILPASVAGAESYPARPITWVLPFPAGGNVDANARMVAKVVGEILGQPSLSKTGARLALSLQKGTN